MKCLLAFFFALLYSSTSYASPILFSATGTMEIDGKWENIYGTMTISDAYRSTRQGPEPLTMGSVMIFFDIEHYVLSTESGFNVNGDGLMATECYGPTTQPIDFTKTYLSNSFSQNGYFTYFYYADGTPYGLDNITEYTVLADIIKTEGALNLTLTRVTPVPEPSTLLLFSIFAPLVFYRYRLLQNTSRAD